ncbi:MAG: hypothetical protein H6740_14130 [Alphaproteobacteria bacterium]|nr:hypothetical protein [Alphaproteobacteria bacterium]
MARLRPNDPDEEAQRLEKQRRFMDRARKGVLKHIVEAGGELHMKDMHDYSERRFFIAHRAFSDMMEFFVEQQLIDFDPSSMMATITQSGRDFIDE